MCPKTEKVYLWTKTFPQNFYLHLKEKLKSIGFKSSESDQCLFTSDKVICLIYADDILLYANDMQAIDDFIAALRKPDMA
jgi:hypothetical protein